MRAGTGVETNLNINFVLELSHTTLAPVYISISTVHFRLQFSQYTVQMLQFQARNSSPYLL